MARDLFLYGNFRLHSGKSSQFKIECEALTLQEWFCLGYQLSLRLPPFGRVEGVPRGGMNLAAMMVEYQTLEAEDPLLIVDDVYTTGGSMEAHRRGRPAIGAVVFARTLVTQPWIAALFQMEPHFQIYPADAI